MKQKKKISQKDWLPCLVQYIYIYIYWFNLIHRFIQSYTIWLHLDLQTNYLLTFYNIGYNNDNNNNSFIQ